VSVAESQLSGIEGLSESQGQGCGRGVVGFVLGLCLPNPIPTLALTPPPPATLNVRVTGINDWSVLATDGGDVVSRGPLWMIHVHSDAHALPTLKRQTVSRRRPGTGPVSKEGIGIFSPPLQIASPMYPN